MNSSVKFWDRIANRYSKQAIVDEAAYQLKLNVTQQLLQPTMDVLELGCGTGTTAIAHAPMVKHIHAIDISSKMLQIAQRNADLKQLKNITFENTAIDSFIASEQSYDLVLGLSILHLVENRDQVISQVHSMLKAHGYFVTSTVCLANTMKFFKLFIPIGHLLGLMPLVTVFSKKELQDSFTNAGFTINHNSQPGKDKSVFIVAQKSG